MTRVQKITPFVMLGVMFLAVAWLLLPFQFTDGADCGPPLLGGKPDNDASVGLVIPEEDCLNKARSRMLTSAMITLIAAGAGTAAVALRPISPQCSRGEHDDCKYGWANLLSENFEGLGCQCECHTDDY